MAFRRPSSGAWASNWKDGACCRRRLYEQETILGDFLRTLREFELNPDQPLELDGC